MLRVKGALEKYYALNDLSAGLCYRLGDWDVLAVSSDSHSWLDFKPGRQVYSTEQAVVYETSNVQFPNLAGGKIQVHIKAEELVAVVFRVVQGESKSGGRSYAINFDEKEAYFCGREKTNENARARLNAVGECTLLPHGIMH